MIKSLNNIQEHSQAILSNVPMHSKIFLSHVLFVACCDPLQMVIVSHVLKLQYVIIITSLCRDHYMVDQVGRVC